MKVREAAAWVRDERTKRGWSAEELAKRARAFAADEGLEFKLSQQSISNFEQAATKKEGAAKRLPVWLRHVRMAFTEDSVAQVRDLQEKVKAELTEFARQNEDLVYVRQVDISYAMGAGAVIEEYPATGQVPFNLQFLRALGARSIETLLLARGEGDSMMPTMINDDLVLIDTAQQVIHESDRIWAIVVGGGGMIKRVRRLPRDQYQIISDNPIVSPQTVGHDDLHVVGRVIWIGRRI